jgi:hypothetical protein
LVNTARSELAGAGTQTSALAFGGELPGPATTGATEEYNGSLGQQSWKFKYFKKKFSRSRNTNCCFSIWWYSTCYNSNRRIQWFNLDNNPTGLNTARYTLAGGGTQTAALGFGGYDTAVTDATESYDGSNWTTVASLATARNN